MNYSQLSQPISDGLAEAGRSLGMLTGAWTGAATATAGVDATGACAFEVLVSFLMAPVDFSMPEAPMDLR